MSDTAVDRRVLRTQQKLRLGLATLLQHKQMADITIRELTNISGINRGTFYLHYSSVTDMVDQLNQETFSELKEICDSFSLTEIAADPEPFLTAILRYIMDRDELCMMIFCKNNGYAFLQLLIRFFCGYFTDRMPRKPFGTRQSSQYYYVYAMAGSSGVLRHWYDNGRMETPEQLAQILKRLLLSGKKNIR